MSRLKPINWTPLLGYFAVCLLPIMAIGSYILLLGNFRFPDGVMYLLYVLLPALSMLTTGGLVYLWLSRRTRKSLRVVDDGMDRLILGEYGVRVYVPDQGHVRSFADRFNRMSAVVKDRILELMGEAANLSTVLDTMADGVVLMDDWGHVSLINESATALLNPLNISGQGLQIRDHELLALAKGASQTGERGHKEVELIPGVRYVNATATPMGDGNTLLVIQDLTKSRQLDNTRKEFVSNVSHELRNPLASITALIDALQDGAIGDPDTAKEFLGRLHMDVDRMTVIVNDLLSLSRIEGDRQSLVFSAALICELIHEAVDSLKFRPPGSEIEFEITADDGLLVMCDRVMMRQVLDNLIHNAIRFTPPAGIIKLASWRTANMIHVCVTDNGVGIAPEHLPHIFERFYKADRSRDSKGTGLGLSIARHIIESHGGTISVESTLGVGTKLEFVLPMSGLL
jgi:two-component system phosphate regulon sensor histidine kinase PhoR